jgi:hypothetical protein
MYNNGGVLAQYVKRVRKGERAEGKKGHHLYPRHNT